LASIIGLQKVIMSKSTKEKSNFGSTKWINPVLQGVAHWIGYKKQFYSGHLINEGAIVSEATGIMSAYMDSNQKMDCEKQYSEISSKINGGERADIVRCTDGKIDFVVEVKRFEAGRKLIELDLFKLSKIKQNNKEIRCCLLLVSQTKAPFPFINDNGVADRLRFTLIGTKHKAKVIRVCKSVSSFRENAYLKADYACLIEVI
jgi:hypothetical protein